MIVFYILFSIFQIKYMTMFFSTVMIKFICTYIDTWHHIHSLLVMSKRDSW
jgi:hypothetical protein